MYLNVAITSAAGKMAPQIDGVDLDALVPGAIGAAVITADDTNAWRQLRSTALPIPTFVLGDPATMDSGQLRVIPIANADALTPADITDAINDYEAKEIPAFFYGICSTLVTPTPPPLLHPDIMPAITMTSLRQVTCSTRRTAIPSLPATLATWSRPSATC